MTDVHMAAPLREEVYVRQPYELPASQGTHIRPAAVDHSTIHSGAITGVQMMQQGSGYDKAALESAELAAFEKGRMQGEMEAIRRAEAEAPLKTMAVAPVGINNNQAAYSSPDIVEINRMTWLQRLSWLVGNACTAGQLVFTIVWLEVWRDGVGWTNSQNNGNTRMLNAGLLAFSIGLFIHSQAISHYRFLPLNLSAHLNRAWYVILQLCTITCYSVTLAALIMSYPSAEDTFWRVDNWCFVLAFAFFVSHALYSIVRTCLDRVFPVTYETWAEVNNRIDGDHDHRLGMMRRHTPIAAGETDRRTVYAPAPHSITRGRNLPAANSNVGAQVPTAPANAPRWAETPRTHANDYFLLPRSKWANAAYWSMGAAFLMLIAAEEMYQAAGTGSWVNNEDGRLLGNMGQSSRQAHWIGGLGLLTLAMLGLMSYASMPPRTTLVKNGVAGVGPDRRTSISQSAPTQVGQPINNNAYGNNNAYAGQNVV